MSISSSIQELSNLRKKLAALESEVASERAKDLSGLPAAYGFESLESFIGAVQAATGGSPKGKGRPATASAKAPATRAAKAVSGGAKRKRRAKITPEMKADLKKRIKAGETGAQIAKALKISLPSVHNVKKELGLVKGR